MLDQEHPNIFNLAGVIRHFRKKGVRILSKRFSGFRDNLELKRKIKKDIEKGAY